MFVLKKLKEVSVCNSVNACVWEGGRGRMLFILEHVWGRLVESWYA